MHTLLVIVVIALVVELIDPMVSLFKWLSLSDIVKGASVPMETGTITYGSLVSLRNPDLNCQLANMPLGLGIQLINNTFCTRGNVNESESGYLIFPGEETAPYLEVDEVLPIVKGKGTGEPVSCGDKVRLVRFDHNKLLEVRSIDDGQVGLQNTQLLNVPATLICDDKTGRYGKPVQLKYRNDFLVADKGRRFPSNYRYGPIRNAYLTKFSESPSYNTFILQPIATVIDPDSDHDLDTNDEL